MRTWPQRLWRRLSGRENIDEQIRLMKEYDHHLGVREGKEQGYHLGYKHGRAEAVPLDVRLEAFRKGHVAGFTEGWDAALNRNEDAGQEGGG